MDPIRVVSNVSAKPLRANAADERKLSIDQVCTKLDADCVEGNIGSSAVVFVCFTSWSNVQDATHWRDIGPVLDDCGRHPASSFRRVLYELTSGRRNPDDLMRESFLVVKWRDALRGEAAAYIANTVATDSSRSTGRKHQLRKATSAGRLGLPKDSAGVTKEEHPAFSEVTGKAWGSSVSLAFDRQCRKLLSNIANGWLPKLATMIKHHASIAIKSFHSGEVLTPPSSFTC